MKKNIFPTPSNETRFQQNDYNKYSPFEKAANVMWRLFIFIGTIEK